MEYSPENLSLILARLRVLSISPPVFWSMERTGDDDISLVAVPYDKMSEREQRHNWKYFLKEVDHHLNNVPDTNKQEK